MKYIIIYIDLDEYDSPYFECTDDLQDVFKKLKEKWLMTNYEIKAYKLGGEITSMEDAVKKEV